MSSGCIAYHQLMKTGFPSHMAINDLLDLFKQNAEYCGHTLNDRKEICSELIRACGLKWRDFKLGNTKIFFRDGKLDILTEKLKCDLSLVIERHKKLKYLREKWRTIATRLYSIWKTRSIQNHSIIITENAAEKERTIEDLSIGEANDKVCPKRSRKRKLESTYTNKISAVETSQQRTFITKISTRTTIAIPSTSEMVPKYVTIEERLRELLRQEKKKNLDLHSDYGKLQRKNLELMAKLNNEQQENNRLVEENKKLNIAIETIRNNVSSDHNY